MPAGSPRAMARFSVRDSPFTIYNSMRHPVRFSGRKATSEPERPRIRNRQLLKVVEHFSFIGERRLQLSFPPLSLWPGFQDARPNAFTALVSVHAVSYKQRMTIVRSRR